MVDVRVCHVELEPGVVDYQEEWGTHREILLHVVEILEHVRIVWHGHLLIKTDLDFVNRGQGETEPPEKGDHHGWTDPFLEGNKPNI